MTILQQLLEPYIGILEQNNIDYVIIGNYDKLPESTGNDVDIWVSNIRKAHHYLQKTALLVGLSPYIINHTANGSNNYFFFYSTGILQIVKIDLMCETAYKSIIPIMLAGQIKASSFEYKGMHVLSEPAETLVHLIYPLLTFRLVKEKYKIKIARMSKDPQFQKLLSSVLGKPSATKILDLIDSRNWAQIQKLKYIVLVSLLKEMTLTGFISRVGILVRHLAWAIFRIANKSGIQIAFTGIDGAGKTTIMEKLIKDSDRYFPKGKSQHRYWRPFLLPKISTLFRAAGATERYSESGTRIVNSDFKSTMLDFIKYNYYVLDYILGQFSHFYCLHTGGLVIYDRYHLDLIIYPQRFGLNVSNALVRFYDKWLIPQPDVMFYFTASTETLFERKRELSFAEVERQKKSYNSIIKSKSFIHTIYTDESIESTYTEVLVRCFSYMKSRYEK